MKSKIGSVLAVLLIAKTAFAQGQDSAFDFTAFLDESNRPIDAQTLESLRGGAEWQSNDILSNGSVGYNLASNLTTGPNFVTAGALEGASGFSTVVQNSGNNVLIQNSTIINLQLQ